MRNSYRHPSPKPRPETANSTHTTYYESAYMKRLHENRPASVPSVSSKSQAQTSHYESSYLKKLNDNPAPSITRSFSHSSRDTSTNNAKTNKSIKAAENRNKLPRVHTNTHQINTISPRSTRSAQSPAATIDAILGEKTNGGTGRSLDSSDRKSFSISPPKIRQHLQQHRERSSSQDRRQPDKIYPSQAAASRPMYEESRYSRNSYYSTYSSENRSPSPTRRSFSRSPPRGTKKDPLTASQRLNYPAPPVHSNRYNSQRSLSREPVKKLPHERRESPIGIRRVPTGGRYSTQFWTHVSVKVSSSLLKSGADKRFAEAAQMAVIEAGSEQYDTSQEALNFVASKASLAVLMAGGSKDQAAIATVACLKADDEEVNQSAELRKQIDRQMSTVAEKTAGFMQSSYDGSVKAVHKFSEIASLQLENLKIMGEKSVQQYHQYQKTLLLERKMQMKRIKSERKMGRGYHDRGIRGRDRDHNRGRRRGDSRDESLEDDRDRRRSRSRRGGGGRYESDNDSLDIHRRRSRRHTKSSSGTFDDSRSSTLYSTSTESSGTGSSGRSFSSSDISRRRRGSRRGSKKSSSSNRERSGSNRRRSRSGGRITHSGSYSSRGTFET